MNFRINSPTFNQTKPEQAMALSKMLNMAQHYALKECSKPEFCEAIRDYMYAADLIDRGFILKPNGGPLGRPKILYDFKKDKTFVPKDALQLQALQS